MPQMCDMLRPFRCSCAAPVPWISAHLPPLDTTHIFHMHTLFINLHTKAFVQLKWISIKYCFTELPRYSNWSVPFTHTCMAMKKLIKNWKILDLWSSNFLWKSQFLKCGIFYDTCIVWWHFKTRMKIVYLIFKKITKLSSYLDEDIRRVWKSQ